MQKNVDSLQIINACWQELQRMHQLLAELRRFNEANNYFGVNPAAFQPLGPSSDAPMWHRKAKQAREYSHRVLQPQSKQGLMKIAETYDRLAE